MYEYVVNVYCSSLPVFFSLGGLTTFLKFWKTDIFVEWTSGDQPAQNSSEPYEKF